MSRAQPRAIETVYGDHVFRSRTEARWAVYFDQLGIVYEYENEGYELNGVRYLPDFWLPCVALRSGPPGMYVEVKGKYPTEPESQKIEICPKPVVVVVGVPPGHDSNGEGAYEWHTNGNEGWDNYMRLMLCSSCGAFKWEFDNSSYECCWKCDAPVVVGSFDGSWMDKRFASAARRALSERFGT